MPARSVVSHSSSSTGWSVAASDSGSARAAARRIPEARSSRNARVPAESGPYARSIAWAPDSASRSPPPSRVSSRRLPSLKRHSPASAPVVAAGHEAGGGGMSIGIPPRIRHSLRWMAETARLRPKRSPLVVIATIRRGSSRSIQAEAWYPGTSPPIETRSGPPTIGTR